MTQTEQVKPKMKIWKKILLAVGVLFAFNVIFMAVGAVLHATYFQSKYKSLTPCGKLVDVYDGKMHVYSMGAGKKTIVLLPGLGIALPSADFGPLMRKLAEKYTVMCVEYFGVGFSSGTKRPRNNENYVDEIRAALKQAGFKPPYVLMPHSISSVYSEYYAAKYPKEVMAIISLDGTGTGYYEKMPEIMKKILPVAKFQQASGITSMLAPLVTNKKDLLARGYTEKEINSLLTIAGFVMNDTLIEQMLNSAEFVKQAMDIPYPESVPYFKIIAKQTYETPNPQLKMTPQEYQRLHLARIGPKAKYEVLEGNHFIYFNNADKIAKIADEFIR